MENEAPKSTNWTKVLLIVVASLLILALATGIGFAVAGTRGDGNCTYRTDTTGQVGTAVGTCHGQGAGVGRGTCTDCDGTDCDGTCTGQGTCTGTGNCQGAAGNGQAAGSCHGQTGSTAAPGASCH
ncbi:MAG: hypothetical protein KKF41_05905 [Actinobacteria bacterium]|nr:hypothetical protein [Actinomycetota bacterium]MBU1944834.1 hypothetical protein [Actinomycetota bacterium]MBU2687099.1 hypothetical protein [Actinomycetota bacterium]